MIRLLKLATLRCEDFCANDMDLVAIWKTTRLLKGFTSERRLYDDLGLFSSKFLALLSAPLSRSCAHQNLCSPFSNQLHSQLSESSCNSDQYWDKPRRDHETLRVPWLSSSFVTWTSDQHRIRFLLSSLHKWNPNVCRVAWLQSSLRLFYPSQLLRLV